MYQITCDDKDPVWMNENIKSKVRAKNKHCQVYVKKSRQETDFCALEETVRNLNGLILQTKTSYNEKLKVPVIPPVLVNNKLVTDKCF